MELIGYMLVLLMLVVGVVFYRAIRFKPMNQPTKAITKDVFDQEGIIQRFSKMIQTKTISNRDISQIDFHQFEAFQQLLFKEYPKVCESCSIIRLGQTGLLFKWSGQSNHNPIVLMSHYDVVPADEAQWTKGPFSGSLAEGSVWGRGTVDTKVTLLSIMEACDHLIKSGFVPNNDIYFSFSGDEEVSGESTPAIVSYFIEKQISPLWVLDEGGMVGQGIFQSNQTFAMIGTGEKGYMDIEIQAFGPGGHASAPPYPNLIGELSKAINQIENHPFKMSVSLPAKEMIKVTGRYTHFLWKLVLANLWCFSSVLDLIARKKGGELNALIRTTCGFTKMSGSKASNVLPTIATVGANIRLNSKDTKEAVLAHLNKIINNPAIKIKVIEGRLASPTTNAHSRGYKQVSQSVRDTWSDVIVSPYLMLAGTDARHYHQICQCVIRFSPLRLTKEEKALMHGNDEHIPVTSLMESVQFYCHLMRQNPNDFE